jgi:hypothetical protein
MDRLLVGREYASHLTDGDLSLTATPAMELWEYLGARWYRAARELAPVDTARVAVVGDVASRFRQARRVLNHLADRYLLPPDRPWFEQPSY